MKKLIKLSDYVIIHCGEYAGIKDAKDILIDCLEYAKLLQQKPTLGMFVPCDEEGNVLEKPEHYDHFAKHGDSLISPSGTFLCKQYQAALDRVLFSGFVRTDNGYCQRRTETELQRVGFYDDEIIFHTFKLNGHCKVESTIKTLEDLTGYELELKQ